LKFDRFHRHIPTRLHPAMGSTSLALMTKHCPQALKNTAMRGQRATAQAQLQPPRTHRGNTRPSSSTWRRHTAASTFAVTLCFISMAAAQPGQCPATWTTAALSVARLFRSVAATSLPSQGLAIFAGGGLSSTYFILFFELLILQDSVMRESGGLCSVKRGAL
jgi:hypothetical protein